MSHADSQHYTRAPVVAVSSGTRRLIVPVRNGVADLDEMVALDDSAARVWDSLASVFSIPEVAERLRIQGAAGSEAALTEARAFVADLAARGLAEGDQSSAPNSDRAAAEVTEPAALDAKTLIRVARVVMEQGHALRFVARGASMQPQLPDSSFVEVEPRPFETVSNGEIALYSVADRLVAHRVEKRQGAHLITRGDSAARIDRVDEASYLGVLTARLERDGASLNRIELATSNARLAGRTFSLLHRIRSRLARVFFVAPVRRIPWLRRALRATIALGSEFLRRAENRAFAARRRLDIVRAALMTTEEKDRERRTLYADKSVRAFTALDENVEAGFTLLEEVLLARHPIAPGRALVVGCGPGRECVAFAKLGFEVTGADYDQAMLERAAELATRHEVELELVHCSGEDLEVPGDPFDVVVIFSGLYNMVLPRARRVAMLRGARRHLVRGGQVVVTFLSDYARPGAAPPIDVPSTWARINPDHEHGDRYLINEAIHVFPHESRFRSEAREAGLIVDVLHRDQRAYERATRQVRGFAVLRRSD